MRPRLRASVGLDFKVPSRAAPELETIRTDLSDPGSVAAAINRIRVSRGQRIVAVVHLAAYYDLSGDPSPMYRKVTVEGTRNLLRALRGMEVAQFIFASTILVHAPTAPGKPINEDWPLDPQTPYPQSKLEAEQVLREERGDMPVVILRCAGIYDDDCHAAFLAQQIANIFEQRLLSRLYPGKMESGQPYLHLDDLVAAILRAVERRTDLPPETTLLIGEPDTMSYGALQARIGELIHGQPWDTREIPAEFAEIGQWLQEDVLDLDPFVQPWMIEQASYHLELDIGRAKQLLGWVPAHALRETLPVMIARLKEDPAGWYRRNKLNPASVAAAKIDRSLAGKAAEARRKAEQKMREADARSRWAALANAGLGLWLCCSATGAPSASPPRRSA
jgi:nucleoside-diphosphate-sugar epimerase